MAIPMQSTSPPSSKSFSDRAIPGTIPKSTSMTVASQQSPSRPSSAAPNVKNSVPRVKSPLAAAGVGEIITTKNLNAVSSPLDSLADALAQTTINHPPESVNQPAMRPAPGAPLPAQPYVTPGHAPYYHHGPNVNMNMPPQQPGYGPPPQNQFFNLGFNPTAYGPGPNTARPNSAIPKYQTVDPKGPAIGHNQMMPPSGPAQQPNNMTRRPSSNYFTMQPTMSPVQTPYAAQRTWIVPGNAQVMGAPMHMQNGTGPLQAPAMYQPLLAANAPSAPMLTPPPPVQPTYQPGYGPQPVVSPVYGFPTPPESSAAAQPNPNIPPPVPSVFPDPAYSNINTCLNNPKGTTNVYIRGLRPETTDEDLLRMVQQYGSIVSTKAILDNQTKLCKGFGFAKFESIQQGVDCIIALTQAGYQCSFAKESFSNRLKDLSEPTNTNLYISNLPLEVDEQRLDDLLKPHRVHSSRILRDQNRQSRGVGFARMTDRESADAVIETWNGQFFPGLETPQTPLQVRYADTPMQKKLKSVTARRRSWRAREYNSLTQGRPLSPSTTRYYEENFGQGNIDYPAAQLYANGGNWSQDGSYSPYAIEATLDPQMSPLQM